MNNVVKWCFMHTEGDYFSQDRGKVDPVGVEATVWSNYD
jgi:hypothetical protein